MRTPPLLQPVYMSSAILRDRPRRCSKDMEPASVDSTTWILSTSLVYYVSVDRYSVVNNFAAVYLKVNVLGLD